MILFFTYYYWILSSFDNPNIFLILSFDSDKYALHFSFFTSNSSFIADYMSPVSKIFIQVKLFLKHSYTSFYFISCFILWPSIECSPLYILSKSDQMSKFCAITKTVVKKSARWINFFISLKSLNGTKDWRQLKAYKLTFLQALRSFFLISFLFLLPF